jgi:WD40 repeat protein
MIASSGPGKRPALRVRDVRTREPIGRPLVGHGFPVTSIAFSPDGKVLASGSANGAVWLWDVHGRPDFGAPVATRAIHALAYSPDGSTIAVAGSKGVARWKARTREQVEQISDGEHTDIAFSPDGEMLASGAERGLPMSGSVAVESRSCSRALTRPMVSRSAPMGRRSQRGTSWR